MTEYRLNDSGDELLDCKRYTVGTSGLTVTVTNNGSWPAGMLDIIYTKDEDGCANYEFRDMNGMVVLTRQRLDGQNVDTYYVRDDWGNLLAVLPPLASRQMQGNGSWSSSSDIISKYAYLYVYDERYRQIAKRLPGCEWVYTVYDKSDTPVLTQDGNQRQQGIWSYTISDAWGRPCRTGTCTNTISMMGSPLQTVVLANRSTGGYTVSGVTLNNEQILTETYYDHYNNIPNGALGYTSGSGYGEKDANNPVGRVTATRSRLLDGSGTYLWSRTFYDYRGNVVQQKSTNHLSGTDADFASYDFTGNVTARKHVHTASGKPTRTEYYTYAYDSWGRMTTEKHQLGTAAEVTVNRNVYDALGRVATLRHGNTANAQLTYAYNVRSWLSSISSPMFSQTLFYNSTAVSGVQPRYSGCLSRMEWRASATAYQGTTCSYNYAYDGLGRLTQAVYGQNSTGPGDYDAYFEYDRQGNIVNIDRYHRNADGDRVKADEVYIEYDGNQMARLECTEPYVGQDMHVRDDANANVEYDYDKNGNMTKDLNRNILSVEYNLLNLPRQVSFGDGNCIAYVYDATGRKLRVEYGTLSYTTAQPQAQTAQAGTTRQTATMTVSSSMDYIGNYIYRNGTQSRITLDCGEVTLPAGSASPTYYYDLRDYQGSVRVAVSGTGAMNYMAHYYPYGAVRFASRAKTYGRNFISKELDRMHGLDWMDFNARMYEPTLGRFTTPDPLAEKYYSVSPYAYCMGDPVKYADTDGRKIIIVYKANNNHYNLTFNGHGKYTYYKSQFVKDFFTAYNYNIKNGGGEYLRAAALDKNHTFYLYDATDSDLVEYKETSFNPQNGKSIVQWESRVGLETTEKGHQSPATRLEHEFYHAVDNAKNPSLRRYKSSTPDPDYDNLEEKEAVQAENKTAELNKESLRYNHQGTTYPTVSPISTKRKD